MKIFLYVPLILCLVGCSKDSNISDKGGAAKDQKVKTEPLPDFPDPMTKEFIMAMWEAPHNVEGIIPEMEKVRLKEGVWKVERKIGPNKNELEDVPATSMTLKFTKRRFHIWKFSFEDFVQFSLMTFDYGKKSYRWWYLMPDDFIGENSGNIAEGENFIWESVVMPEENGKGAKMKSVEDLSLRKTNEDPVTIEIQMLRKDEIIWVAEDTLTWTSKLLKEGQIKSKETRQSEVISSPLEKNKLDKVIKTGEKARVKSDLGEIEIGLLNYKISAGSYPTTEQGLSALLTKPADVRAWEGPYSRESSINDPWGNEYGYRFPSQKRQDKPDIFSKGPDGLENTEDDIGNWEAEEDNPKVVVEEVKIKRPKLTPKQISDYLEFWTGKWEGFDKATNLIGDSFEAKWKEKGVSLEFKGITFEAGEQKDTYKGSIYYDKGLGVFVDTGTYEKPGKTFIRHVILDPESGETNGFAVDPKPPEGMEVKFNWKKVDPNNVDYTFEVLRGGDTLDYKEFRVKRQKK